MGSPDFLKTLRRKIKLPEDWSVAEQGSAGAVPGRCRGIAGLGHCQAQWAETARLIASTVNRVNSANGGTCSTTSWARHSEKKEEGK